MSRDYEPPKNPDIHNMDLKELKKYREYLIEKIEEHLPELVGIVDFYIEEKS